MPWTRFWEKDAPVYVSERHKRAHYAIIAQDVLRFVDHADASVLDYGCGEAWSAPSVAGNVRHLFLCDRSSHVRTGLAERLSGAPNISILTPDDVVRLPPASLDIIVVNSVLQYVGQPAAREMLSELGGKLAPRGRLVVGDIIPPDLGALTDARALLALGLAHGFFLDALVGLARAAASDYARTRARHGLTRYTEEAFVALASEAGLDAVRHRPNLGHNPHRLTFVARAAGAAVKPSLVGAPTG